MEKGIFQKIKLGPATFVTAAFIGPGTVTMCTMAGVKNGYSLLWALFFSVMVTIISQEMAARLGIISRLDLGETLRKKFTHPVARALMLFLVLSAIFIGNSAYEAGNISGAVLGMDYFGVFNKKLLVVLIGGLAGLFLWKGGEGLLRKFLTILVLIMSVCFVWTAVMVRPDVVEVLKGIFVPTLILEEILLITGLIGTTIVPYNLFLHAALARDQWDENQVKEMRLDTIVSIVLGGILSMCIVITAAGIQGTEIKNAADLAAGLQPTLGDWSGYLVAIGLFSAGITSAITAPYAAALATKGILGWQNDLQSWPFRIIWGVVLLTGILFSSLNINAIELITFAQITNGILLPLIIAFLIYSVNDSQLMNEWKNKSWQNLLAFVILVICTGVAGNALYKIIFL